jgi:hypothetical protein
MQNKLSQVRSSSSFTPINRHIHSGCLITHSSPSKYSQNSQRQEKIQQHNKLLENKIRLTASHYQLMQAEAARHNKLTSDWKLLQRNKIKINFDDGHNESDTPISEEEARIPPIPIHRSPIRF